MTVLDNIATMRTFPKHQVLRETVLGLFIFCETTFLSPVACLWGLGIFARYLKTMTNRNKGLFTQGKRQIWKVSLSKWLIFLVVPSAKNVRLSVPYHFCSYNHRTIAHKPPDHSFPMLCSGVWLMNPTAFPGKTLTLWLLKVMQWFEVVVVSLANWSEPRICALWFHI